MVDPTPSSEVPRSYPDSYHQQHRNSILFSVLTILLCFPNFSINLDEALFIQSSSKSLSGLVPWAAWISALYSTLHFYLEWRDYAKPHGLAVDSHLDQIEREMRSISQGVDGMDPLSQSANMIKSILREMDFKSVQSWDDSKLSSDLLKAGGVVASSQLQADNTLREMLKRYPAITSNESLVRHLQSGIQEKHAALLQALKDEFSRQREERQNDLQKILRFGHTAEKLHSEIAEFLTKLDAVLREPRWVKRQVDLTRRWTATRVWVVGFFPPFALCLMASLVFADSRTGYHLMRLVFGQSVFI